MTDIDLLGHALRTFADMDENAFALSIPYWQKKSAFTVAMTRTEGFLFLTPEQRYLDLLEHHPDIFNAIPLYHISSYLGIQGPSLSRIRKRMIGH